jgi:hypothetical protein
MLALTNKEIVGLHTKGKIAHHCVYICGNHLDKNWIPPGKIPDPNSPEGSFPSTCTQIRPPQSGYSTYVQRDVRT